MFDLLKNQKTKSWVSLGLLAIIILLASFFIYHHREDLAKISSISPPFVALISFLILIFILLNGLRVKAIMELFEIHLPVKEWLGLAVITTMSNYFVPMRGGASTRAMYLKKKYNFQYTKFLASMAGTYVIIFSVTSFLGIIALLFYYGIFRVLYSEILLFFLLVFVLTIVLSFLLKKSTKLKVRWKIISKIFEGFSYFRNKSNKILTLGVVQTASCFIMALRLFFAYLALNIKVDFIHVFIVGLLSALSIIVSLTPGNLGIKEAIVTFSSQLLGYKASDGFLVAVIDRSLALLIIFILGPIFSYLLLKTPRLGITPRKEVQRR